MPEDAKPGDGGTNEPVKGPATPPPLPHLRKPEADAEKAASSSPYYGEAKVRKPTGPPPLPSRRGAQSPSAPATPTGDPKPKAETKPEPQAKAAAPGAKSPAAGPVPGPAAPGEVVRPKRSLMLRSKVRALLSALPKGKAKKKPRPDAEPLPEAKTTPTTDLFSPESEAAQTPAPEGWKELAEGDLEPYATDIGQGNLFLGIDRDLDPRTEVPPAPDVRRKEREQEMERDLALRKKTVRLAVRPTPSAETPEAQPPAEPVPEPVPPPSDTGPSNDPKGVRPEQPRLRDQLHAKSTEPEPVELPTVRPAERDKPETVRPEEELPATEVKAPRIEKAPPPEAKPQEPFSRPETKEPLSTISQFGPTRPRQQVSLPKVEMLSKKPQPLLSRQRKAEEDAKLAAQEEARRQAQEEERRRIEEEARRRAEAEAQRRREEEAARRKAEEEAAAKRRAEEEARRKAEEEAAAKRREEEEARRKAEAEATAKRLAEEEARREAQRQEALRRAEEEALRETEESARRQAREGAGELPVSSPTESAEAVDDKPVEEGEGTPAGEAAAHPSIGPVILPPTFSQLHQPSGPRLPGVEQPSDEDFDWSSPPPVEPAAPTEQPTEEPPAAEPVVDESAPAETAKDVPALEPTPVDEPVIEAKSGVQPPPLPTVVEATKPVVDEPAPVESEKGIPAPEPAPADEPVIEAKSGVQPPPLPITVAAAESAPVIETKAPENSDDQAPEASPPETGESEAPKKGWRDPSVVRSQEEREARRVAESEARLRAREQLEARRKSLEQADPSATQAETKKPEPLLARRRKGGGMEPAVRAKQGERARLQPAEKRAAPRDLAGEKPGAEAAAAAAAEKAPLKAPRDMAGDETRQQEKERRKAEVRRRPRKQRKRLSPLVARLIAYPVVIILVLTLAFTTYYSLRETRIDGVVALTADYKVNEAAIVKDFRSEALVISEDLAQARQPLRHDIREREDIIARAQADLAGRKERIRLLREEIDNANKEVEEIIRQARMDSQKILSETGATLEAEYTSKLNALKGMIQRRAAELHLPYEPTTEFESPEIWVNAYRLALYDAPDTIDSAKERMWVEARLTDWKNYEADWNKRQADLKKEVERVQATPKDKIEDVNRRVARLNLRIEETQAEMAPIQAELDGNQKMLDQLVTQDRSLDRPYYEMLLSTPDKNKLYNLHVDGPTGQFSWRDISLKEFPPGNYLLWVKATRGNEVYWSVVPFPLEAYRSQLIVIEEGAFMPLTEVLHNGVGAGAAR